jgi:hypothetical protein
VLRLPLVFGQSRVSFATASFHTVGIDQGFASTGGGNEWV